MVATRPPSLSPVVVLVTRPEPQAQEWAEALRERGVHATSLPLLRVAALPGAETATADAWVSLPRFRLVMFVSPNAVARFFAARPASAVWPADVRAAATGPGTVAALAAHHVPRELIVAPPPSAPRFDSDALWEILRGEDWRGGQVLIVRGEEGRDAFSRQLREAGAEVRLLSAYRREAPRWSPTERALALHALDRPDRHAWLMSSSEAIGHLVTFLRDAGRSLPPGALALCTHPRIAQTAREAGFERVLEVRPAPQAVVEALSALAPDLTL
jgi:uroporphyrinogen-III synthase